MVFMIYRISLFIVFPDFVVFSPALLAASALLARLRALDVAHLVPVVQEPRPVVRLRRQAVQRMVAPRLWISVQHTARGLQCSRMAGCCRGHPGELTLVVSLGM